MLYNGIFDTTMIVKNKLNSLKDLCGTLHVRKQRLTTINNFVLTNWTKNPTSILSWIPFFVLEDMALIFGMVATEMGAEILSALNCQI